MGKLRGNLSGKAGCPNYYLAGDTAFAYQREGTDQLDNVFWRLLWEDKRYLKGYLPVEEDEYFNEKPETPLPIPQLRAMPGQPCPKTGRWLTTALLEKRSFQINAGELMPPAEYDKSGNAVIWYLNET